MPAISQNQLIIEILDAIQFSGGTASYISASSRNHPREFLVGYNGEQFSIWVYIWTLTHGGRVSLPNEYRIQMTSVNSPLRLNPNGYTVLLGYHPDLKVFAGFDIEKHKTFTAGSPSVQIDITALHEALQNGLSFSKKDNDEIAVGIRQEQFLSYCLNAEHLHKFGYEPKIYTALTKAVELQSIDVDVRTLTAERKRVVESISRLSRDANFRKNVLNAYDNRCAVTRVQLRLVDAAHILPVAAPNSSDHVSNGISLSPTFHRAYDNCLIYLDDEFKMQLNTERIGELRSVNLVGGLDKFSEFLNKKIHLPQELSKRPKPEFISKANQYRRIPGYF